ncbi:protein kinase [Pelagibacteraceae bacterium]|nr:protein kinase [Pelagibacteraceae bacterium]
MNELIGKKYNICGRLGKGNFGSVYKGKHYKNNTEVAIKFEDTNTNIKLLRHETTILKYLYERDTRNIPAVSWFGIHNHYTCLVMTLYECSLYDYVITKGNLSVSKISSIIYQLVTILKSVHDNSVIHRDIKPQNIMVKSGELYLIDFGFSTIFIDEDGEHVPDDCSEHIIGSPKYVSYNIHTGAIPSRRDDLISLGYLYLFLHEKQLSWENIGDDMGVNDEYDETSIYHYKNILRQEMKQISAIDFTSTSDDHNLQNYLKYVYHLKYEEQPNYEAILDLFTYN